MDGYLNLTIKTANINEGDTVVIECEVYVYPPAAPQHFYWAINDRDALNNPRINISSTLDPVSDILTSVLTLQNSSWQDNGKLNTFGYMHIVDNQQVLIVRFVN